MSDYDMTFDKKIVEDKSFDTIFGGEEDNHLLDLVLKEDADAFNIDERDPESIEDGLGKIGAGDGLGSDLGPDKDTANKPTDDSSDQKALTTDKNLDKDDQLNISDTTGEKPEDGGMVDKKDMAAAGTDELVGNDPIPDEENLTDALNKVADKTDSFDEAAARLLEEVGDDELPEEPAPEAPVAPTTEPVDPVAAPADVPVADTIDAVPAADAVPVPAPEAPVAPDVATNVPVAPASDAGVPEDIDLLNTDPVADAPADVPADECGTACKKESADVTDFDTESFEEADDLIQNDKVDFNGVEDQSGKPGDDKESLGAEAGPDNDTANAPKEDTSDAEVTPKDDQELKKDDQLNTSSDAGANKVEDGGMVKDFANAGEDGKSASDSFKEASVDELEAAPEEEEDEIIDAVEENKEKSEYTAAELNADEDDEILSMLD